LIPERPKARKKEKGDEAASCMTFLSPQNAEGPDCCAPLTTQRPFRVSA
jgi:hypothetical protein